MIEQNVVLELTLDGSRQYVDRYFCLPVRYLSIEKVQPFFGESMRVPKQ